MGGFAFLNDGIEVSLSAGAQRILAFLALHRMTMRRLYVASSLWPEVEEKNALASLRSELWRVPNAVRRAIQAGASEIRLSSNLSVDFHDSAGLAAAILDPSSGAREHELSHKSVGMLSADLLPGWYEDWVLMQAEHWRHTRLHALEELSRHLQCLGRNSQAVEAALAAVHAEPLRETAQAALVSAHLSGGNQSEALRAFERYSQRLYRELGLEPTELLRNLIPGNKSVTRP